MKNKIVPVIVAIAVLAVSIGIFQYMAHNPADEAAHNAFEKAATNETNMDEYAAAVAEAIEIEPSSDSTDTPSQQSTPVVSTTPARVENGMLTIGNADAPVTILEFSSLSCPHCASFHKNTLGALKKDYVDTGKVKFVFYDFPLNQQALHGTLLLQCVDGQDRYALMEMLFDQQAQWAFEGDHQTKLRQYAALLGLSNDRADECMDDTAKEQEILQKMKAASEQYNIRSTPSFVILPQPETITGAQSYGMFSTAIEKRMN
jgi:protein-disulfide isomerase